MPGMPGMGSGPGKRGKQQPQRKKSKSGNPAKRAAEEREAAQKAATRPAGSSFGAEGEAPGLDPASLDPAQLPKGFEKFLGK
jgi:signal recognition particle subunit SRP54